MNLSAFNAQGDAFFAVCEVVLVSPAAAVVKHLAPLGLGVVCEPPLYTVTCSPFHGTEAHLCGLGVFWFLVSIIGLHLRFMYSQFRVYHGWLHNNGFSSRLCVDFWCLGGFDWVLTFRVALQHAPEIVGVAKAAAVKESLALLTVAVKEVALQQPSTGTRSLG